MKTKQILISSTISLGILLTVFSCMLDLESGTTTTPSIQTTTFSSSLEKHLIRTAQAKILEDEYENKNYKIINANRKNPDTREVYYDIDALEDYIKYVKAEAKKKGIEEVGITIAFAQYPNNANFDSRLKKEYQGQQTVFLKAATKSQESYKVGIGGYNKENENNGVEDIQAFDFGQLTPPER
jgi:hypothetical protein